MNFTHIPDGTFTIENKETGEFRTFNIDLRTFKPQPGSDKGPEQKWVLSYLRGPSNSSDFEPFAFVFGHSVEDMVISVWRSKRSADPNERSQYERFALLVGLVLGSKAGIGAPKWGERYDVLEAIPCRRCGEQLTVPDSIRRGIGPVCAKKAA